MYQMSNKTTPNGFTIRFDRHRRAWGWKQTIDAQAAKDAGHPTERFTFSRRPEALRDLELELRRRAAIAPAPRPRSTAETTIA